MFSSVRVGRIRRLETEARVAQLQYIFFLFFFLTTPQPNRLCLTVIIAHCSLSYLYNDRNGNPQGDVAVEQPANIDDAWKSGSPNLMDGSCQWHCGSSGRELNAATGPFPVVLSLGLIAYAASSSRFGSQSYFIGQRPDLSAIIRELAPRDPAVLLCR
jgi:hypothetical protein